MAPRTDRRFLFLFLLIALNIFSFLQGEEIFEHFTIENGLASNSIRVLFQDRRGFLWIGTDSGLSRFDGYEFLTFVHQPGNTNSLSSDSITCIVEDREGILWIGTQDGLNSLDPSRNKWKRYYPDPKNTLSLSHAAISSLWIDADDHVWVGTLGGAISRFDSRRGQWRRYPESRSPIWDYIHTITGDRYGRLWLGTAQDGLIELDIRQGTWENIRISSLVSGRNQGGWDKIWSLYHDNAENLWVASDAGVCRISKNQSGEILFLDQSPDKMTKAVCIHATEGDEIWAGSAVGGLWRHKPESREWKNWRTDTADVSSLSSDQISAVLKDRTGCVWMGSSTRGLNKYNANLSVWKNTRIAATAQVSNQIQAICKDSRGAVWIGTSGQGVIEYQAAESKWTTHRGGNTALTSGLIYCIFEDSRGYIWVGTLDGLNRFDPRSRRWQSFKRALSPDSLNYTQVNSIDEDKWGTLWLATNGVGLNRFDPATGEWTPYLYAPQNSKDATNFCWVVKADPAGDIWVGTWGDGLKRFNPQKEEWIHYPYGNGQSAGTGNGKIRDLALDQAGRLWVVTDQNGIDSYQRSRNAWKHFGTQDGLPHDEVYSVKADSQGRIWIFSKRGLSRLTPGYNQIRNYDKRDGLKSLDFSSPANAFFQDDSGEIIFSWFDHFTAFSPAQIREIREPPPLAFIDFKIFEESVPSMLLQKEGISLSHRKNFFSFSFTALDFSIPSKNFYAYKLDGMNNEWIQLGEHHQVSFSNLEGGRYTLRVKAANSDGIWNEKGISIPVQIRPPFWKTLWFYLIVTFFLVLSIVIGHNLRIRNLKYRQWELERVVDERTRQLCLAFVDLENINSNLQGQIKERIRMEEQLKDANRRLQESLEQLKQLDQLKTDFLNLASHELRTPLTSVIGFAKIIKRKFNDTILPNLKSKKDESFGGTLKKMRENMDIIVSEGNRLTKLINDLLDIAKMEAGKLDWRKSRICIGNVVEQAVMATTPLFEEKEISVESNVSGHPLEMNGDPDRLKQVMINLLSNAVKFTPKGGEIRIIGHRARNVYRAEIDFPGDEVEISVIDNGAGISPEDQEKLFQKFHQVGECKEGETRGTGLGLHICKQIIDYHGGRIWVQSCPGKGSTFTFRLPLLARDTTKVIPQ